MYDIAIIGGGPAGASAALFAAKAGKQVILFDSGKSITAKAWIENHYGVKEIEGPALLKEGQSQATKFGTKLVKENINTLKENEGFFTLQSDQQDYEALHVVFATGMSTKLADTAGLTIKEGTEPRVAKIIETDPEGRTSRKNVWAAGTAAGMSVHTIITAGDGAKVAVNVISELNGERYVDHDVL
ncbi:FAD-dependent oxidoreductase [Halobacillus sp. A5]|uniref:FAD-dependent oxidoreductase n=1 Tax=Halobacillus sp. A5 TaxID=2880263 RepID=UPI0020A62DC9|nr:FAD-dependent oxidoreductase [Halobacillus sp. A5]MCP3026324.1 FAD-dependent oxidoreductase [Halobacillus sp. A5]